MARRIDRTHRFANTVRKKWSPTEKQRHASKVLLHNPLFPRILFDGGARSGKTESIVRFFVTRALQYPESNQIALRKIRRSARSSVWESFQRHLRSYLSPDNYAMYNDDMMILFNNDSLITCDGLDDSNRLENILGTEYITIFLNEATQLSYNFVNLLRTRIAQRVQHARNHSVYASPKFIADCNPRHKRHWLYRLCIEGVDPTVIDHPQPLQESAKWQHLTWTPFDNLQNLAPNYVEQSLDPLPEKIRARMRDGKWVNTEGCVYDNFDEDRHVIPVFHFDPSYRVYRAVDFGYTNPFCCLWFAVRTDLRHIVIFDELYGRQVTVSNHAPRIREMSEIYPPVETTICDWEADQRATLEEHGIPTTKADKTLLDGIERVYRALWTSFADQPLLQMTENCVNTIGEFYSYAWPSPEMMTMNSLANGRDEPIDRDNHAMSCIRYMINHIQEELEIEGILRPFIEPHSLIDTSLSTGGKHSIPFSEPDLWGNVNVMDQDMWNATYGDL